MAERITWVDYIWKDEEVSGDTRAMVVILNDPELYEDLHKNEGFDERVWFYFQDEAEFKRAFDPNNDEFEFTLISEIGEKTLGTDKEFSKMTL